MSRTEPVVPRDRQEAPVRRQREVLGSARVDLTLLTGSEIPRNDPRAHRVVDRPSVGRPCGLPHDAHPSALHDRADVARSARRSGTSRGGLSRPGRRPGSSAHRATSGAAGCFSSAGAAPPACRSRATGWRSWPGLARPAPGSTRRPGAFRHATTRATGFAPTSRRLACEGGAATLPVFGSSSATYTSCIPV